MRKKLLLLAVERAQIYSGFGCEKTFREADSKKTTM